MVRKGLGYLITVQGVSELWKEEEIVGRFLDPPIICAVCLPGKGNSHSALLQRSLSIISGKICENSQKMIY